MKKNRTIIFSILLAAILSILLCLYFLGVSKSIAPTSGKHKMSVLVENDSLNENNFFYRDGFWIKKPNNVNEIFRHYSVSTTGIWSFPLSLGNKQLDYQFMDDAQEHTDAYNYITLNYLGLDTTARSLKVHFSKYKIYHFDNGDYLGTLAFLDSNKETNNYGYKNPKKINYFLLSSKKDGVSFKVTAHLFWIKFWINLERILEFVIIAFIIVYTIMLVLNISRGKAFAKTNLYWLKWNALFCFFIMAYPYVATCILYLIYFKDLYPEVSFTHSFWAGDYKWCAAGIVYLLLHLAFRKGYKLQQEQDLTI